MPDLVPSACDCGACKPTGEGCPSCGCPSGMHVTSEWYRPGRPNIVKTMCHSCKKFCGNGGEK